MRRTGGGVEPLQPLSEQDERLLSLMGGPSFAEGDQEVSVRLNIQVSFLFRYLFIGYSVDNTVTIVISFINRNKELML